MIVNNRREVNGLLQILINLPEDFIRSNLEGVSVISWEMIVNLIGRMLKICSLARDTQIPVSD